MSDYKPTEKILVDIYKNLRTLIPEDREIAMLHITDEQTSICIGSNSEKPESSWVLPLGSLKTSTEFFRHNPPTPDEIEYAINLIEDEVVAIKKYMPQNISLYTSSKVIADIALYAPASELAKQQVVSRESMESIFSRLALIISGRPASTDILPTDNHFAASMLILREVMHHLDFKDITIF